MLRVSSKAPFLFLAIIFLLTACNPAIDTAGSADPNASNGNGSGGDDGNGGSGSSQTPSPAPIVSVGGSYACRLINGDVECWGEYSDGQMGHNTMTQNVPVQVSGLSSGVTAISSSANDFACAVVNGAAQCWGRNEYGQLGNDSYTDSSTPVQVQGLTSGVTSIAVGYPISPV